MKKYLSRDEIIILLEAFDKFDNSQILNFIDDKEEKNEIINIINSGRTYQKLEYILESEYSNIAKKIKKEDYDILIQNINNIHNLNLIIATGDSRYIKECLNIKNLNIKTKISLIVALGKKEELKKFLIKNKYKFMPSELLYIIRKIDDAEYIKKCIEDNLFKLTKKHIVSLVIATKDDEYMKKYLEKNEDIETTSKVLILKEISDKEYVKKQLKNKNMKFDNRDITYIVISIEEEKCTKKYIESKKTKLEDKSDLLITLNDKKYVKEFINQNTNKLKKHKEILFKILNSTNDNEYIYDQLISKEYNLETTEIVKAIAKTKDNILLARYLKEYPQKCGEKEKILLNILRNPDEFKDIEGNFKKIDIPKGMTIGIEIESEGKYSSALPYKLLNNHWKSKKETSLKDGIEIVSNVLTGSEEESEEIYQMCNFLKDIGQTTSKRCGGHIHIGADFLKSKRAYFNLLEIYLNCEDLIYLISNEENSIVRDAIEEYCMPIGKQTESSLIQNINLEGTKEEFAEDLKNKGISKYAGLNFDNIGNSKNTIEFRVPNGTIKPDIWIENINLIGGIIAVAQELSIIQQKDSTKLSEEEKKKLCSFQELKQNRNFK